MILIKKTIFFCIKKSITSKEVELLNSKDKTHNLDAQIQLLEQNIQELKNKQLKK